MSYKALRSNCIVEVYTGEEKSAGGIITALDNDKFQMAKEEGHVVNLGCDFNFDTEAQDQVKVGDKVVFARYCGKSLGKGPNGKELRVMRDVDLLAKIEE